MAIHPKQNECVISGQKVILPGDGPLVITGTNTDIGPIHHKAEAIYQMVLESAESGFSKIFPPENFLKTQRTGTLRKLRRDIVKALIKMHQEEAGAKTGTSTILDFLSPEKLSQAVETVKIEWVKKIRGKSQETLADKQNIPPEEPQLMPLLTDSI